MKQGRRVASINPKRSLWKKTNKTNFDYIINRYTSFESSSFPMALKDLKIKFIKVPLFLLASFDTNKLGFVSSFSPTASTQSDMAALRPFPFANDLH